MAGAFHAFFALWLIAIAIWLNIVLVTLWIVKAFSYALDFLLFSAVTQYRYFAVGFVSKWSIEVWNTLESVDLDCNRCIYILTFLWDVLCVFDYKYRPLWGWSGVCEYRECLSRLCPRSPRGPPRGPFWAKMVPKIAKRTPRAIIGQKHWFSLGFLRFETKNIDFP